MAVLAGVLAAVLPVVRVTIVAAAEGTLATSAWAALTAADACGAIALAIFWSACSNAAIGPPVPTTMLPFGSMLTVEELSSPPVLTIDPCEARQRRQVGPVATIEQAIHDRRRGAEEARPQLGPGCPSRLR